MTGRGLLKQHSTLISIGIKAADIILLILTAWLAFFIRFQHVLLDQKYLIAVLFACLLVIPVNKFFGVYQPFRGQIVWARIRQIFLALATLLLLLLAIGFTVKESTHFSRIWFFTWFGTLFISMLLLRVGLYFGLGFMRQKGLNQKNIILIGGDELGRAIINSAATALWTGYRICGWFDDSNKTTSKHEIKLERMPANLAAYIDAQNIDEVWIALALKAEDKVKALLQQLQHNIITIRYFPDVFGMDLLNHSISDMLGFPVVNIKSSPMVGINRLVKAAEDRLLSGLILIVLSPIMCVIAVLVKLTSKGPILYKQKRLGWDGRPIKVYKFRSMVVHTEAEGQVTQACRNDARFTRVGKFLRRTSLDELPQFFNVLQGRMSIVGPRPHVLVQNETFKDIVPSYMQRHQVKPGITGWAQINGWRGETDSLEKLEKRTQHDLFYINHWSLWFDVKIIVMTVFKGFFNKNAY